LLLTVDLEGRVERRTAQLRAAQQELQVKNSELVRQAAQLETANKELEAFSYSVSHDLRAPLRHIRAYVGSLGEDRDSQLSSEGRHLVTRISDAADRMSKLIEDLLAFSRGGRAEIVHTQVDMGELVKEVRAEMASDARGRNIEWEIERLPTVGGDRALLKQVWVNLLSNAIKYTRPRDPARIRILWAQKGGEEEFCVQDNGVGFDMRYAGKLFDVFKRLHDAQEFEGTGVGLANVRRTISRHGGRSWAEAQINKGTSIYFTLPIVKKGIDNLNEKRSDSAKAR
jgi:light-regulated signal transduction histidine kinase (bacteriophytochrome)